MTALTVKRYGVGGLVALLSLLATSACVPIGMLKPPVEPTSATVPEVIGLTESNAKQVISDANLTPNVNRENGPDDPTKNTVTRQSPASGTTVPLGSTVTITVNVGPLAGLIPADLIGQTESAARLELAAAGFTNVIVETASAGTLEPPTAKAGDVLDVKPMPGTSAPLDTQITLVLASGQTPMPSLKGLTEEDAKTALAAAGFTDVRVTHQVNGDVPKGTVFMTNPDAGTPAFRANPVFIYIAD